MKLNCVLIFLVLLFYPASAWTKEPGVMLKGHLSKPSLTKESISFRFTGRLHFFLLHQCSPKVEETLAENARLAENAIELSVYRQDCKSRASDVTTYVESITIHAHRDRAVFRRLEGEPVPIMQLYEKNNRLDFLVGTRYIVLQGPLRLELSEKSEVTHISARTTIVVILRDEKDTGA